jgi:hypothetical protein
MFEHFTRLLETYLVKRIVAGVTAVAGVTTVAGVTAAAYGVVAEAADDVVVKVADEVIAEIVENASNMQEVPAVNDVIVLGIIPKQDSQNRRGSCCR